MNTRLLAIVGGIAVGKTTIGYRIAESLTNSCFIQEDVSRNEFLSNFYDDMKRWAFHSRISTLAMISSNYVFEKDKYDYILMDRCLDELINFAKLQYEIGNLDAREFSVYTEIYRNFVHLAQPIDHFIYCYCTPETSMKRIKKRNRSFERNIKIDYIEHLNGIYEKWVSSIPKQKVIKIDTDNGISDYDLAGIYSIIG